MKSKTASLSQEWKDEMKACILFVFLVLIVSGCGDGSTDQDSTTPASAGPSPTSIPTAVAEPTLPPTPAATATPEPTPEPKTNLSPGMYQVGNDIQPGVYAGLASTDIFGSCYWARLSGASGDFSELISNANANGQFYVEIQPDDKFFKVDCEITPLNDWPTPPEPLSEIGPGLYLVGRDIKPGTYRGEAGSDVLSSCYWARLSGLSGDFGHLIANDNAAGQFFVTVTPSDLALSTSCKLTLAE
jgi:hypothetical protein